MWKLIDENIFDGNLWMRFRWMAKKVVGTWEDYFLPDRFVEFAFRFLVLLPLLLVKMHTKRRKAVPIRPCPPPLFPVPQDFGCCSIWSPPTGSCCWPIEHSIEEWPEVVVVISVDGFWIILRPVRCFIGIVDWSQAENQNTFAINNVYLRNWPGCWFLLAFSWWKREPVAILGRVADFCMPMLIKYAWENSKSWGISETNKF